MKEQTYSFQLAKEALFVGATLIPFVVLAENNIQNRYFAITLAGAIYHLTAEASGINAWYIKHGATTLHEIHEAYEASYDHIKTTQTIL